MESKLNFKDYENEILFLLNNPGKINRVSFYEQNYKTNINNLMPLIKERNSLEYTSEVAAYLLGKACEIVMLSYLRPKLKSIWISANEIDENITTNLPAHLHDVVLEVMSGCENAIDEYLKDDTNIEDLLLKIQFIGEMITTKYKLYDISVEGFSNKEIAFPSELYTFANNLMLKQLTEEGYKVEALSENHNSAISCILLKGNIKMAVLESVVVEPLKPRFPNSKKKELIKFANDNMCIPYILAIGVSSSDETIREKKVVPIEGKTVIRRSDFITVE